MTPETERGMVLHPHRTLFSEATQGETYLRGTEAKQILRNIFKQDPVIIPLRGYIQNDDYRRAKQPIATGWNSPDFLGLSEEKIDEHLQNGGWIGLKVPKGYIVVDVDDKDQGKLLSEILRAEGTHAYQIVTPNGWQFIFKDTGKIPKQTAKTLTKGLFVVDYRLAERGQIVIPTRNTLGRRWVEESLEHEPSELPLYLEPLKPVRKEEDVIPLPIEEGRRNEILFRHVSRLRDFLQDEGEIRRIVFWMNKWLCKPPLDEEEVEAILKLRPGYSYLRGQIEGTMEETAEDEDDFRPTDMWNAKMFAERYKGIVLWVPAWNKWMVYENGKWQEDNREKVLKMAKDLIVDYYRMASEIQDDKKRKALVKHALASESQRKIKAMIELAKSESAVEPETFDQDPFVINLKNGTFNLSTLEFAPHRAEDLITKQMNVEYNPKAECPRWEEFLRKIFQENEEMIDFVQRALGYSLTGDVSEDCLFICWGSGQNGKSTFFKTLMHIFGDYAKDTPSETFLLKKNDGIPNDIARLRGARLVVASETPEGRRINEVLIKKLTGRDKITARFLRQEFFEFEPTFKIWIITNHKPIVNENSFAFWRRIRLIPFTYTIKESERIPGYEKTLLEEKSGILNWMIEGYIKWRLDGGLKIPTAVKEATEEYQDEMDVLNAFIEECCEVGADKKVLNSDLYKAYKEWCDRNEENPMSKKSFSLRLQERGFKDKKFAHGKRGWIGLGLKEGQGG